MFTVISSHLIVPIALVVLIAFTPEAFALIALPLRCDSNTELNRPICRREGKMERNGWRAIGTETEAERQELSGGRYQGRQPLQSANS